MKKIHYGRQCIDKTDIDQVVNILKSDWITQGSKVKEFEDALAKYCGAKYAVAVSSGTAALHLACLVAGLKKCDEVITTPITFLATASSILYTGAKPVFVDIDYENINIDTQKIEEKITRKTKAIMPVHFAGLPCDMVKIGAIAKEKKLVIIEDACHALGAEYKHNGRWSKVGSCKHSNMAVFSFHPVKTITTGEGGAITTNNKNIYKKLLALRSHGVYKDQFTVKKCGPWYGEMRDLGFNYRITDFQCALGVSQLKKLDAFIKKRREIARVYNSELCELKDLVKFPQLVDKDRKHAWHLYILRLNPNKLKSNKIQIFNQLKRRNINLQLHYIPVVNHPFYRSMGYSTMGYPVATRYYEETISLPIFPDLTKKDLIYVITNIKEVLYKYAE